MMTANPVTYEPLKSAPEEAVEAVPVDSRRKMSSCAARVVRVLVITCVVFVVSAALETAFDGAISGCMQLRGHDGRGRPHSLQDERDAGSRVRFDNGPAVDSRPCKVLYDGCNTCMRTHVSDHFACTERFCEQPGKEYCKIYFSPAEITHNKGMPMHAPMRPQADFAGKRPPIMVVSHAKEDMDAPQNCKTWFTGCNTCHRATPGAMLACTRKMCHGASPSSCLETFDDAEMKKLDEVDLGDDEKIVPVDIVDSVRSVDPARNVDFDTPTPVRPAPQVKPYKLPADGLPIRKGDLSAKIFAAKPKAATESATAAPEDCRQWFDGCNTCTRGEVGGPMACTRMACFDASEPSCKEYFSS